MARDPVDGLTGENGTVHVADRQAKRGLTASEMPENEAKDYKVVCVRLRTLEFEQFTRAVQAMQLTSSMALRIAARRIGGFLEIDHDVRQTLAELLRAIGQLSQAVRDLHAVCLAGETITIEQLDDQRVEFGIAFAQLDAMLRSILNVSHRRDDGRTLLTEAASE